MTKKDHSSTWSMSLANPCLVCKKCIKFLDKMCEATTKELGTVTEEIETIKSAYWKTRFSVGLSYSKE